MDSDFSTLLRTYRKSMGWTQEELAQKWSYSFETISAWERGKRTPGSQEIPRIARFLEVEAEKLAELITSGHLQPSAGAQFPTNSTQAKWKASFETWREVQHIYRNRTEFNSDFSYARLFEQAQTILAAGISLNAIALTYSKDDLFEAVAERDCKITLCFLDPDGKRCAEREEEEDYPPKTLAHLTSINILIMKTVRSRLENASKEKAENLEIRVYDLIPRLNIYLVDDTLMTVQSYGYGRGEDTPTLFLKRKTKGGLFDFYASSAHYIFEHSRSIDSLP